MLSIRPSGTNFSEIRINSLAPGGFDYSLKLVNFKLISTINIWSIFCEIAIRWMPQHPTDHWSTLVQVMAWCCQATSHYLSQCWPRSMSPYGVTRPQWVKLRWFSFYISKCCLENVSHFLSLIVLIIVILSAGGNGYINDYPTGRLLRDAKLYEIGAGTSEIRRLVIGRALNSEYKS